MPSMITIKTKKAKEENKMEFNLCGGSGCCPKVVTNGEHVEIGEEGNLVKLKREEWNTLVEAVKEGKLKRI